MYILEDLKQKKLITDEEARVSGFAIAPKALISPINNEENLRATILRNILINIIKEG